MDLSQIDDITLLESLAYKQMVGLQVAQTNLQLIQERIRQVEQASEAVAELAPKNKK